MLSTNVKYISVFQDFPALHHLNSLLNDLKIFLLTSVLLKIQMCDIGLLVFAKIYVCQQVFSAAIFICL